VRLPYFYVVSAANCLNQWGEKQGWGDEMKMEALLLFYKDFFHFNSCLVVHLFVFLAFLKDLMKSERGNNKASSPNYRLMQVTIAE